ncbi:unnamed protein product [Arctia plantaginis]|uniref:Endonuclease/exonuclease/phosphatase domain-containing protein n=1 Tax=Arctia plantaginis TaxID=874455 RepID=A0A8S1ALM3_ARCPL|nr:unnamed protein product [Arctia plantaginis]
MTRSKFLKFGLFNAGSLGTRHDEFLIAMDLHAVDIMAINETWLRSGEDGRAPLVPGYRLRYIPRPISVRGGRGGGVGFYIRNGVKVQTRSHPTNNEVEQYWLSLNIAGKKLLIDTAYRPPWLLTETFLDSLTESISALAPYDHMYYIIGGF